MPPSDLDQFLPKSDGPVQWTGVSVRALIRKIKSLIPTSSADIGWKETPGGAKGFVKRRARGDGVDSSGNSFTPPFFVTQLPPQGVVAHVNVDAGVIAHPDGEIISVGGQDFPLPAGTHVNHIIYLSVTDGAIHSVDEGSYPAQGTWQNVKLARLQITGAVGAVPQVVTDMQQLWSGNVYMVVVKHNHEDINAGGNKISLPVDPDDPDDTNPSFKVGGAEHIFTDGTGQKCLAAKWKAPS